MTAARSDLMRALADRLSGHLGPFAFLTEGEKKLAIEALRLAASQPDRLAEVKQVHKLRHLLTHMPDKDFYLPREEARELLRYIDALSLLSGAGTKSDGGERSYCRGCGNQSYDNKFGCSICDMDAERPSDPSPGPDVREALEPFAKIADWYSDSEDDDFGPWVDVINVEDLRRLKLKDFRRARAALTRPLGGFVQGSIATKQSTDPEGSSRTEFPTLHEANIARQREWDPDDRITLAYRGNELAGEIGEACNVIKKLERERLGINGSRDTVEHLMEELADGVICASLCAMQVGGNLDAAVEAKFNATSEKMGLKTRLRLKAVAETDADAQRDDGLVSEVSADVGRC